MKNKISINIFFYIAWILMEINICFANSSAYKYISSFGSYISLFCGGLFCLKIILTRYSLKEIILNVVLIGCSFMSFKVSGDARVLWFVLAIIAAKGIDFKRIVKYSLITLCICCFIFILLSLFGITNISSVYYNKGTRFYFGMGHPNICSAYYNIIFAHFGYLYFDKIKIRHICFSTAGAIAIYLLTKSKTGILVYILVLLSFILLKKNFLKKNIQNRILIIALTSCIVFFTVLPIIYNNEKKYMNNIDNFMTGRFSQANFYIKKYGINFLGNNVLEDLTSEYTHNILDIGYSRMLICNGIYYYIIVVGGYLYILINTYKRKLNDLTFFVSFFIVYMCSENVATYVFMNVSMLYFSQIFFKCNKNKELEDKYNEQET